MAGCVITTGWTKPACVNRFSVPGIERDDIWVINKDDIASLTLTGDQISAIVFEVGKVAYKIAFQKETPSWSEELIRENSGSHYTQTMTGRVIDDSEATRKAIEDMVDVDVLLVVRQRSGDFYALGETGGVTLSENTKSSGATTGDESGDVLTYTGTNLGKTKQFFDTDEATTLATLNGYL